MIKEENPINKWFQIIWRSITITIIGGISTYISITAIVGFGVSATTNPAYATGSIIGTGFTLYIIIKYIVMQMIKEIKQYYTRKTK